MQCLYHKCDGGGLFFCLFSGRRPPSVLQTGGVGAAEDWTGLHQRLYPSCLKSDSWENHSNISLMLTCQFAAALNSWFNLEIYFEAYFVIVYLHVSGFCLMSQISVERPVYIKVKLPTQTTCCCFPDSSCVRHQGESEHRSSAQPDHRLWLHTGGKTPCRHPDPTIHCMMRSHSESVHLQNTGSRRGLLFCSAGSVISTQDLNLRTSS